MIPGTSRPGIDVESILNDEQVSIENLTAHANARYAIKDYDAAAELYSKATELQAESNGEMSTKNADLLYFYGRCLYHVAVSNSDVLGSKIAGEKRDEEKPKPKRRRLNDTAATTPVNNGMHDKGERVAEEASLRIAEAKEEDGGAKRGVLSTDKPYFQFTGDENFDDSDDNSEVGAEDEEPNDEFQNAYEVLDLARLLLQRRYAEAEAAAVNERRGKEENSNSDAFASNALEQLKERLADTHDLQAEISLEGERFPAAVVDLRAALAIKKELFPQDSSILAEAHYKLSLALEFSSMTQQYEADVHGTAVQGHKQQAGNADEVLREEAAKEMEAAITSCKLRIDKEEKALRAHADVPLAIEGEAKKPKVTRESIDDVIDMVMDMEQRLKELREPPVSENDLTETGKLDGTHLLNGVLGTMLGKSPEAQKARVEEATRNANDVSGLVKRKKGDRLKNGIVESISSEKGAKRKVTLVEDEEEVGGWKRERTKEE